MLGVELQVNGVGIEAIVRYLRRSAEASLHGNMEDRGILRIGNQVKLEVAVRVLNSSLGHVERTPTVKAGETNAYVLESNEATLGKHRRKLGLELRQDNLGGASGGLEDEVSLAHRDPLETITFGNRSERRAQQRDGLWDHELEFNRLDI